MMESSEQDNEVTKKHKDLLASKRTIWTGLPSLHPTYSNFYSIEVYIFCSILQLLNRIQRDIYSITLHAVVALLHEQSLFTLCIKM